MEGLEAAVTTRELLAPALAALCAGLHLKVKVEWRPASAVVGVMVAPGSGAAAGMLRMHPVPCVAVRVDWTAG